jgi:RNA polymerase sigma factor (sigma-70 family)
LTYLLYEEHNRKTWSESLREINQAFSENFFKHEVLTFDEAKKLSEIYRGCSEDNEFQGKVISSDQAKEIFVSRNLKLVRRIVLVMRNTFEQVEMSDLFQSGMLGLIRAVEKWDPDREFQFSTYATWHIRQTITRFTLDNYVPIRIPIYLADKIIRVKNYLTQYIDFFDFEPDATEAADALDMTEDEYLNCREAMFSFVSFEDSFESSRLYFETSNFREPHCEIYSDPANSLSYHFLAQELHSVLDTLSDREAGIIALRFGLATGACHTLEDIGQIYGVTRERIRQIEAKTMSRLRHPSRSDHLREYLDINDPRWEANNGIQASQGESELDVLETENENYPAIVSHELYCGGW